MIELNNLTARKIDEDFLKEIVSQVLKGEKVKKEVELSIVLVGTARMRKLNKEYRGKNRTTDILSFGGVEALPMARSDLLLGELVLCPRVVGKNAKRLNSSFEKEMTVCLIHGVLHLLGRDHAKGEKEAREMESKQDEYLLKLFANNK